MALNLQQVDEIDAAVRKAKVKLQVGYQRRFDQAHLMAQKAVREGKLGTLEMVSSRTRDPPGNPQGWLTDPKLSGGIWLDTVTHDFDSILFLTGADVIKVYAEAATLVYDQLKPKGDFDNVVITIKLSNGAIGYIDSCAFTPYGYDIRVELIGTKAAIVIDMGSNSSYNLLGKSSSEVDTPQTYQERFAQAYRDEMEDFARSILTDSKPRAGIEEGRAAIRIGLAAWESAKEGKPVTLQSG
jgi:predicted dehydrogenase